MTDSSDELLPFSTSAQLPEYPFHSDHSSFGPDRIHHRRFRTILPGNAARERTRVKTLRGAFLELQRTLPAVPPDTKLSKLDVLVLATTYIAHLMRTLNEDVDENQLFAAHGIMHPVKKWPMRSRLYAGILSSTYPLFDHKPDANGRHVQWIQESQRDSSSIPWQRFAHTKPYDIECQEYFNSYNGVYNASND